MGIRQWLGIGGSSDGTAGGSFSVWKVVAGIGHVALDATDPIVTAMGTAIQSIAAVLKLNIDQGSASAGGASTITDAAKKWGTDIWKGYYVRITAGVGIGQVRKIESNTANEITVSPSWTTQPVVNSAYVIDSEPSRLYLPVAGASPSEVVGVFGHQNQDYTYAIAAGKTVVFHPLVHGVSVIVATAAAEAVSAAGLVVTFTDLNTDLSTVTTMRAKLAASNAAGLVSIELGTAVVGDTWNHLLTLGATNLWASGTIPATMLMGLYPDGYIWPLEVDATGGAKMSLSSLLFSEDGSRSTMRVEHQGTSSGLLAASAAVVPAGAAGRAYGAIINGTGAGITVNLRDDGVIGGAIKCQFVVGINTYATIDLLDLPYGNGLYMEIAAGAGGCNVLYRNG